MHAFFQLICLVLSASSLVARADQQSVAKVLETEIALNWKAEPQFGGFYAAERIGAYTSKGLKVRLTEGGAGTPTVQMVAAGRVQFGLVSGDELVIARARGADVVGLFAVYQTSPHAIMTHANRGFKSIADVYAAEGMLALQSGLSYSDFLKQKFKLTKVRIVPYQGGVGAFLADPKFSQQCFITSEPLLAKRQGKESKTFLIADIGYNPYTTVLVTRGDFLKKNEAAVKQMVEAVRAGWQDYLQNPEPTNKIMAQLNKSMDMQTFADSAEAQKPLIQTEETKVNGLGFMSEQRWQRLSQQLLELKYIDRLPPVGDLYRWYSPNIARSSR